MGQRKDNPDGISELRSAVKLFANCNETFNQQFSPKQLIKIYRAYNRCDWDITPDKWTSNQIKQAINSGMSPQFDDEERPIELTVNGRSVLFLHNIP